MPHKTLPVVSIITPSFNQGEFIEQTINSVLTQDYPNIEYIIIDGGSTDNTIDILKKYNSQIKWLSEKDNGQSDAINKGFKMTEGEIIYWLNSDDIILPGTISSIVAEYNKKPDVDVIYGKCHFTDTSDKIIGQYPTEPFNLKRLAMFNFICQPSTFFKRDAYFKIGCLNEKLQYAMDYDLWIRMAQKFKFHYVPEYFSCYKLHEASKTVDSKQAMANNKETLEVVLEHFKWAPANRVFSYYLQLTENKIRKFCSPHKLFSIPVALLISTVQYLRLNKRIAKEDIKAINLSYIKKIFINWNDLYKHY